jgi:hypothetical protein
MTAALKPAEETVTWYEPIESEGTSQSPALDVVAVNLAPVASFITDTDAPGIFAPCGSTTVPDKRDVVTCADASTAPNRHASANK